jgi:hypothetical protein
VSERTPVDDATDLLSLDYDGKVKLLQQVAGEILALKMEFAKVSGRYAELRAEMQVLKEVKSALQSAIRAETL